MYKKQIAHFIRKYHVEIILVIILAISIFFRFFEYENRLGFAYDQARDVIVSRFAVQNHGLPLTGPFSSAGPFVYGPQWYWILMGMILTYPFSIYTPWVIQTSMYVGIVLIMFVIGKETKDKYLGLILAILTCFSSGQIAQATNLTSPSMVGILAALSTLFLVRAVKYSKKIDYFLLSFVVGNAICTHFQAIGLLIYLPLALIFGQSFFIRRYVLSLMSQGRKKAAFNPGPDARELIKFTLIIMCGLIIPFIPLIIFDFISNHFESKNMLQYYFHDQYKISFEVLGRRWLSYVLDFWPHAWARVVGGNNIVLLAVVIFGTIVVISKHRKVEKLTSMFILAYLFVFFELRYFRGPLFDGYIAFLHPVIIILTGILIFNLIKRNKYIGFFAMTILLAGSLWLTIQDISYSDNAIKRSLEQVSKQLVEKYPNKKIVLYDYRYKTSNYSIPLSLFLSLQKSNSEKISIGMYDRNIKNYKNPLTMEGFTFIVLKEVDIKDKKWISVDPSNVYHSVVGWYK